MLRVICRGFCFALLLVPAVCLTTGCSGKGTNTVVEQVEETPEEKKAREEAYEAQMK